MKSLAHFVIKKSESIQLKKICCSDQNIENHNDMYVCIKCGSVNSYKYVIEYVDFHQNKYKFCRKSVYQRKYHIENIIYVKKMVFRFL